MHSVLFKIGSFPIHSYGFMLALSFLVGIWLGARRAKKNNLDPNILMDLGFWVIFAAIVGARLYYVLIDMDSFFGPGRHWTDIFNPFQRGQVGIGGLVMYGGFIGAIAAGIVFFRIKKAPFLPYADAAAPSVGIGIFLTRIGCFLNGCCYGGQSHSGLGVSFPLDSPAGDYQREIAHSLQHADAAVNLKAAAASIHLFPSQLLESAGGLLIALILLFISRRKTFEGFQFYLLGVMYAVLRFAGDFTRFYPSTQRLGPLSHNQVVCIALFVIFGGLILRHYLLKDEKPPAGTQPPDAA